MSGEVLFRPEWFFIGILLTLLLGQQLYWSFIVFRLNDRLMSRDLVEYRKANTKSELKIASKPSEEPVGLDPIAEENARNANRLLL